MDEACVQGHMKKRMVLRMGMYEMNAQSTVCVKKQ